MPTARSEVALWRWRASRNCAEHRKRCWMAVLAFAPSATGCFSGARSVRSTTPQSTRHQKIFRKRALALGLIVATPYNSRLPFFRGAFTEIGATVWAGAVSAAVIEFGATRCFYRALMDGAPREAIDMACQHGGISGAIKNLRGCLTRGLRTTIIVSSLRRGARVAKGGRL